jgi:hypothetical protein
MVWYDTATDLRGGIEMLRRQFVFGLPLATQVALSAPPQGVLIIIEEKAGELLIALLSPAVAEKIKVWLQGKPKSEIAKQLLLDLSRQLDWVKETRQRYMGSILEYLSALSDPKKPTPDPLDTQHSAQELIRALRGLEENLNSLKSGLHIFSPDAKPELDRYMEGKGEDIKSVPQLATMSLKERNAFRKRFIERGMLFDRAMDHLTRFMASNLKLKDTV